MLLREALSLRESGDIKIFKSKLRRQLNNPIKPDRDLFITLA